MANNKSTQNYFKLSNNTTTNVNTHKKTPKIIDIKKCLINNNNKVKNNGCLDNNYNLVNNKRGQSVSNKQKLYNQQNMKYYSKKIKNKNERLKIRTKNNTVLNSKSIVQNSNYVEYTDILDDEKILKRNYSNDVHKKVINSISNSKSKSLSKTKTKNCVKIKNKINLNEIHGLIEDIKKIKKKKIIQTSNISANQSHKNSFNQSKNTLTKK